jgi:hypothetical protein
MTMRRWLTAAASLAIGIGAMVPAARVQAQDVALVYRLLQDGQMVVHPVGGPPRTAQLGERLSNGDTVRTSENTRAALRFTNDGSILRINPGSTVRLTSGDERGVFVRTLQLEFGEVWARVNRRNGAEFRIQTPAGVAAVKGTEFLVRVDADSVTTVITLEGVVEFFNQAGRTDVTAGRKVEARSQTDAPEATPATPEELQQAEGAKEDGAAPGEGTWIAVQLQDADGRMRTLMIQVPADALRGRLQGRP